MKYYIATKLENHAEHNRLRDMLFSQGHQITYDWSTHGPVYGDGLKRVREVAQLELEGVLQADIIIVIWPGGRGTHVELGAALAARKPVILVSDVAGHHIASPDTCAFYHHPLVTLVPTLLDAFALLRNAGTKIAISRNEQEAIKELVAFYRYANFPDTRAGRAASSLQTLVRKFNQPQGSVTAE